MGLCRLPSLPESNKAMAMLKVVQNGCFSRVHGLYPHPQPVGLGKTGLQTTLSLDIVGRGTVFSIQYPLVVQHTPGNHGLVS